MYRATLLSIAILLFAQVLQAQQQMPAMKEMIAAERAFARASFRSDTRRAFLSYLSDSAILFQPGPVNGKAFWEKAVAGSELLSWEPIFAEVSASGDLGYTTGPWEFRENRTSGMPAVAAGHFVSIWKKTGTDWKVVLDIGITHRPSSEKEIPDFSARPGTTSRSIDSMAAAAELLDAEQQFIDAQARQGTAAYTGLLLPGSRIYRAGTVPAITDAERQSIFASDRLRKLTHKRVAGAVAASGDLGYVFGTTRIEQTDNVAPVLQGNYLRIWKKVNGKWKIVLDLIHVGRQE